MSKTGCIRIVRARVNDIEVVNPDTDAKYTRDLVFERSLRSAINIDMVYRVKSTG